MAYVRDKDFFGDLELIEGVNRVATVTAMEPVELVEINRVRLRRNLSALPASDHQVPSLRTRSRGEDGGAKQTGMMFVANMVELGMAQARSALIINMDLCTRCGNCVKACGDLHGHSRLIRRGKKLTRREQKSNALENLFFPNSCIHCRTPECMTGCPTGSIARDKEGEVYIKDFCIGCGACAKNCEFGNISIVSLANEDGAETKKAKPKKKAVKCDICKDYSAPNCVYNCPQAAILRVDPTAYFEELHNQVDLVSMANQ